MLFSNNDKGKLSLIIEVESCTVRGTLTLTEKTDNMADVPKTVFACASPVPWKQNTDSSYLVKTTEKSIQNVINTITRHLHVISNSNFTNIPRKIFAVHYVLSSPWIISQAKLLSIDFEKETKITNDYILDLVKKEREKIMPSQTEAVRVIEEKIFDVRLNGYSVADWQNKETRSLSVSFTTSVAGVHTINRLMALCEHVVHANKIHFHSSLLLQFIGMSKSTQLNNDYTLIHIHGELTDVAVIRGGSCVFFGSYPFGARTLVRKIGLSTKLNQHAADSLVTLYTGGHLDPVQNKKAFASIKTLSGGWVKELEKILSVSTYKIHHSASVVISSCAHEDCFAETLRELYPGIKTTMISETEFLPMAIHSMYE